MFSVFLLIGNCTETTEKARRAAKNIGEKIQMYDKGKIILGLIIFVGFFTFPIWYDLANGKAALKEPVLVFPSKENQKECVADTQYMRTKHMILLNDWRYEVVRNGKRIYVSSTHKDFNMSLNKTCLNCHSNASEFCDKCHTYIGVSVYCWDCHVESLPARSEMISQKPESE